MCIRSEMSRVSFINSSILHPLIPSRENFSNVLHRTPFKNSSYNLKASSHRNQFLRFDLSRQICLAKVKKSIWGEFIVLSSRISSPIEVDM